MVQLSLHWSYFELNVPIFSLCRVALHLHALISKCIHVGKFDNFEISFLKIEMKILIHNIMQHFCFSVSKIQSKALGEVWIQSK